MNQLVPLVEILAALQQICNEQKSGTLYIVSADKHSAQFVIDHGCILDAVFGGLTHGLAAIDRIKHITQGRYSFTEGKFFLSKKQNNSLMEENSLVSNQEIFAALGVANNQQKSQPIPQGKVLVVDDSMMVRKVVARSLQAEGYQVVEATNGNEAISQVILEKPDLILLDIIMPGMDGYKVLSLLKSHADFKSTPVIMLSSRDKLFDKLKGRMSGSDEYLTKPFQVDELVSKVRHHLNSARH